MMKMKILTMLNYLKDPKGQRNVLFAAIIITIIFFRGCGSGTSDVDAMMYEQNINALRDSVRTYVAKNGDLVFEKAALLTESGDLKKYNKDLADEMENLKDRAIFLSKIKTKVKHDTLYLEPKIDPSSITYNADSTIKIIPFTWGDTTEYAPDNYHRIAGMYIIEVDSSLNVSTKNFAITTDEIGISFTTGITENKDGLLEIFIKSPYPGFTPTSIDGALIDPRESKVIKKFFPPKRWSIGPYIGYGLYVGNGIGLAPSVGISLQYGILQWGKK